MISKSANPPFKSQPASSGSPQIDALRPFLTQRIEDLARRRLFEGLKFFDAHNMRSEFNRGEAKLVLLYVLACNPHEFLTADEWEVLAGCQRTKKQHVSNTVAAFRGQEND